jgi:hypothetical protein
MTSSGFHRADVKPSMNALDLLADPQLISVKVDVVPTKTQYLATAHAVEQ